VVITPYKKRTDDYVENLFQIQSCRHAARVLDVADVSQRDWHRDQVILYTNPTTKLDHAVFIDFASTTQTWEPHGLNLFDNYFGLFRVLLGELGRIQSLVSLGSDTCLVPCGFRRRNEAH